MGGEQCGLHASEFEQEQNKGETDLKEHNREAELEGPPREAAGISAVRVALYVSVGEDRE